MASGFASAAACVRVNMIGLEGCGARVQAQTPTKRVKRGSQGVDRRGGGSQGVDRQAERERKKEEQEERKRAQVRK